jgi:hypothetical protein
MLRQYEMAIEQRERAVKDELYRLYDEATRDGNHQRKLFWMSQRAALDVRTPLWGPKAEWEKGFPGVEFPERLNRILQQYEKRYYDASAKLQDDYEELATDLVRRGRTKDAAALRADAKDRWALVDLKPQPPGEESLVVEPPSAEIPSPPVPPPQEPQPPMVPKKVESKDSPVDEPISAPPEVVEAVDAPGAAVATIVSPTIGTLLNGREEGRRQALVDAFGGSNATEAAVARALEWLAKQQDKKDDLWSLQGPYVNGGSQENRLAATAMALLAFQGAGNTPHSGKHRRVVERAWKALAKRQQGDGRFDVEPAIPFTHEMYSHAQATIAACELYGMTKDEQYGEIARRATEYAVRAQSPGGGWKYTPGKDGDMSVTSWFVMALKSAEMAGLSVPAATFEGVNRFLDNVSVENGLRYRYERKIESLVTMATSAEGLLCRRYLGGQKDDPPLTAGFQQLFNKQEIELKLEADVYACYAVTQVARFLGGDEWRQWNDSMKEVLPAWQVANGAEAGSWNPGLDRWAKEGGRLFITCFNTYMLEAYYRYLPIN